MHRTLKLCVAKCSNGKMNIPYCSVTDLLLFRVQIMSVGREVKIGELDAQTPTKNQFVTTKARNMLKSDPLTLSKSLKFISISLNF